MVPLLVGAHVNGVEGEGIWRVRGDADQEGRGEMTFAGLDLGTNLDSKEGKRMRRCNGGWIQGSGVGEMLWV